MRIFSSKNIQYFSLVIILIWSSEFSYAAKSDSTKTTKVEFSFGLTNNGIIKQEVIEDFYLREFNLRYDRGAPSFAHVSQDRKVTHLNYFTNISFTFNNKLRFSFLFGFNPIKATASYGEGRIFHDLIFSQKNFNTQLSSSYMVLLGKVELSTGVFLNYSFFNEGFLKTKYTLHDTPNGTEIFYDGFYTPKGFSFSAGPRIGIGYSVFRHLKFVTGLYSGVSYFKSEKLASVDYNIDTSEREYYFDYSLQKTFISGIEFYFGINYEF